MMDAKITQLTERGTGAPLYPVTSAGAVLMQNGATAEEAVSATALQTVIDMWELIGGTYNKLTGFFELNGLTDITYKEALTILRYSAPLAKPNTTYDTAFKQGTMRTLPVIRAYEVLPMARMFYQCGQLEVVRFHVDDHMYTSMLNSFSGCVNLKQVLYLNAQRCTNIGGCFTGCRALEQVYIYHLPCSVSFADSPNLSLDSLRYIVANAVNSGVITITLHADVYARIIDETNAEWHALLSTAQAKNISFATV